MKLLKRIRNVPQPLSFIVATVMRSLALTWRVRIRDPHGILAEETIAPRVFILWHNRLVSMPAVIPKRVRANIGILASQSRDGNYIASFLEQFGFVTIRGSSSRGGMQALREMYKHIKRGGSVAVTPDGPRGPRYELHDGILWLARKAKVAVVPISVNSPSRWEFGGWDQAQMPKPFARVELVLGDPIAVETLTQLSDDDARALLREHLMATTVDDR